MAHLTVVGEKSLIALNAEQDFILQDVLLSKQGLLTLGTVIAVSHHG